MQNIPKRLTALLRDIVYAQDAGIPVAEDFHKAFVSLSTIDRLMVEADIERARMVKEGISVYPRPEQQTFIIGLIDRPYKQPGDPIPEILPKDDTE